MSFSYRIDVVVLALRSPSETIAERLRSPHVERVIPRSQILPEVGKHALPGVNRRFAIVDLGASIVEESVLCAWIHDNLMVNVGGLDGLLQLLAYGFAGVGVVLSVNC